MRNKNYLVLVIGILLVVTLLITTVSARDFNIYNSSNFAQSFFIVNGSTGLVGVGTSTPQNLFNVLGAGNFTSNLTIDENVFFVNAISNRVGIGTSTPQNLFNVLGAGNFTSNLTIDENVFFVNAINNRVGIGTSTPQNLFNVLGAGNFTSNLTIDENVFFVNAINNRVGIGTSTPQNTLNVVGDLNVTGNFSSRGNMTFTGLNNYIIFSGAGGGLQTAYDPISIYADTDNNGAGNLINLGGNGFNNYLTLSNTGYVGIGTTSPKNKLDIEGGAVIGATYSGTNTAPSNGLLVEGKVGIGTTSPTGDGKVLHLNGSATAYFHLTNAITESALTDGSDIHVYEDDLFIRNSEPSGSILFSTNGVNRVSINSTGTVEIGTAGNQLVISSDGYIGDVDDSLNVNDNLEVSGSIWSAGNLVLDTTTSFAGGDITSGTYDNLAIADDSHNHVYANIDATSSGNWATRVTDNTGSGAWVFATFPTLYYPTFVNPTLGAATATSISSGSFTDGTATLTGGALTGLGSVTTNYLQATGDINVNGGIYISEGVIWSNLAGFITINDGLAVNTLSSGDTVDVCRDSSNLLSDCSSSARYKTNFTNLTQGLEFVEKLNPVVFDWKDTGREDVGFIAEEVEKINPLFVTYKNGTIEGVKYKQLTTVLTNAIKEQQVMIGDLNLSVNLSNAQIKKISDNLDLTNDKVNSSEKKIQELESQVENLQQQLTEIQSQLANGNFQINVSNVKDEKVEEIEIVSSELKPVKLSSVLFGKIMNLF